MRYHSTTFVVYTYRYRHRYIRCVVPVPELEHHVKDQDILKIEGSFQLPIARTHGLTSHSTHCRLD